MENFYTLAEFFAAHGWSPPTLQVIAIWKCRKEVTYRLYCFDNRIDAETFADAFGGMLFDPKRDRENGKALGAWRRQGTYEEERYIGPLALPKFFRDNP